MTSRRPGLMVGVLLAVAALLSGCDSNGGTEAVPSSLTLPPDPGAPNSSTTSATGPVVTPPTNPPAEGAPNVLTLAAEATDPACPGGTTPVEVSFSAADQPPVRVFSVFVDGTPAVASGSPGALIVPSVACDGDVHAVQLIATGTDGASSTRAVAFRAPPAP